MRAVPAAVDAEDAPAATAERLTDAIAAAAETMAAAAAFDIARTAAKPVLRKSRYDKSETAGEITEIRDFSRQNI